MDLRILVWDIFLFKKGSPDMEEGVDHFQSKSDKTDAQTQPLSKKGTIRN